MDSWRESWVSSSRSSSLCVRAVVVVVLRGPAVASVLLRLCRLSAVVVERGCGVDWAVVEVFKVAFLSSEEESRAVSLAWRSAAMR